MTERDHNPTKRRLHLPIVGVTNGPSDASGVNARVERLVFGCRDLRFGAVRSKFRIADSDLLNHRVEVIEGVLAAECMALVKSFFERRR